MAGLGARTPFQNIRDSGMTHAFHELSCAFPYIDLEPTKFAVDSSNELVYPISSFRGISNGDADAGADAVVGVLKISSQTSR